MSNESENRIDLTQFEGIGKWEVEKQPDGSYAIKTGRDNFSLEEAETIAKLPSLIAELERCYYLIAKMQESIVKTIGECWVCGDYIDSCDSNTCERQILEDIELGTASE